MKRILLTFVALISCALLVYGQSSVVTPNTISQIVSQTNTFSSQQTFSAGVVITAATTPANGAPNVVFNTASASTNANITATTMATAGASGNTYEFSAYADQTVAGTSCTGNTTIAVNLIFTDPGASVTNTMQVEVLQAPGPTPSGTFSVTNNGAVGTNLGTAITHTLRVKASTTIQYSTTVTPGATCAPVPSYQIYPALVQVS